MKTIWFISHATTLPKYAVRMRTNNLAKYITKKGYNVEIFSASTVHNTDINLVNDKRKLFVEHKFNDVIYNSIRTSSYKGNGLKRIVNMIQFPVRLMRVAKMKERKPDIIISNPQSIFGIIPFLISKKYKANFITEVRDLWPESIVAYTGISKKNFIIRIMYFFEKWIYKHADRIIFTMEGGKNYIIDKRWDKDIDISKIFHINNGVDLEEFNKNKELYNIKDPDLLNPIKYKVIYTGSIRTANNVKIIVDVAQKIKQLGDSNIIFLVYGEGSEKKKLEEFCVNNGIDNVKFKGFVNKKYIPFILSNASLNILHFEQNKLKKYGASLNKLFEYFASGRPVLSDCMFGYDLISRYNCGTVIDNPSIDLLAESILEFSRISNEQYLQYCENAILAAKDYDYKILAEKLIRLLDFDK